MNEVDRFLSRPQRAPSNAALLRGLLPLLPDSSLTDLIAAARNNVRAHPEPGGIEHLRLTCELLARVAEASSDRDGLLADALDAFEAVPDWSEEYSEALTYLRDLLPLVSSDGLPRYLQAALTVPVTLPGARRQALATVAGRLPEAARERVFAAALAVPHEFESAAAGVIGATAADLPEGLLPLAKSLAGGLSEPGERAQAEAAIVPRLSGVERDEAVARILNEAPRLDRFALANTLSDLAPVLSGPAIDAAIEGAIGSGGGAESVSILLALGQRLPASGRQRLIDAEKRRLAAGGADAGGVSEIVSTLDPAERAEFLASALPALVNDGYSFARVAPMLPEEALGQALDLVAKLSDDYARQGVLQALVPRLPASLVVRAGGIIDAIPAERDRTLLLVLLAERVPEDMHEERDQLLDTAVEEAAALPEEYLRRGAWEQLLTRLTGHRLNDVIGAYTLKPDGTRSLLPLAPWLSRLALELPERCSIASMVLHQMPEAGRSYDNAHVAQEIIPYLERGDLLRAVDIFGEVVEPAALPGLLVKLAERLRDDGDGREAGRLIAGAVSAARGVADAERGVALSGIARFLDFEQLGEARDALALVDRTYAPPDYVLQLLSPVIAAQAALAAGDERLRFLEEALTVALSEPWPTGLGGGPGPDTLHVDVEALVAQVRSAPDAERDALLSQILDAVRTDDPRWRMHQTAAMAGPPEESGPPETAAVGGDPLPAPTPPPGPPSVPPPAPAPQRRMRGGPSRGVTANAGPRGETSTAAPIPPMPVAVNFGAWTDQQIEIEQPATLFVTFSREALVVPRGQTGGTSSAEVDPTRDLVAMVIGRKNVRVTGKSTQSCPVPAGSEPAELFFEIVGTDLGEAQIDVILRQSQDVLGKISVRPEVVQEVRSGAGRAQVTASVETAGQLGPPRPQLFINEEVRGGRVAYVFNLSVFLPDGSVQAFRGESAPLLTEKLDYLKGLYARIEKMWGASRDEIAMFADEIRSEGGTLWDQLVPAEIQRALWTFRDELDFIQVYSDEPFIPWEIVHMKEPGQRNLPAETLFLGQLGLVRWLLPEGNRGHSAGPRKLRLRPDKIRAVAPRYTAGSDWELPGAADELRLLRDVFGSVQEVPADVTSLKAALQPDAFDLLHYVGHGQGDSTSIGDEGLILAVDMIDGAWQPRMVMRASYISQNASLQAGDYRPMVVLNCCETGRQGYTLTSIGGMAEAFVYAGAGVFVSALWSVDDGSAPKFSRALYESLRGGDTLAAAVRKAREAIRNDGDQSWLAYTVYGDPLAVLEA